MFSFLRRAAEAIGVLLFALLFLVFVIQITARFAFNQPLPWTDEAATMLYVWAILWGGAAVCREREHVVFDLLYQGQSLRMQRGMALLSSLLIGGLALWALPGVVDYIQFMKRESTAVMGLPLHWVYAPFAFLLLSLIVRNFLRTWRLLGRRWATVLEEMT